MKKEKILTLEVAKELLASFLSKKELLTTSHRKPWKQAE